MIRSAPSLAPNEQDRLDQCEKAIERGLNTFVEVGLALTEIRDAKLYRITHKTFEAYCKERWEISRPRAYALIEQATVGVALAEAAGSNLSCMQDISSRDAAAVKADLPAVTAEIKARVEQGVAPEVAAKDVVKETADKAKAEKAAKQAENAAARQAAADALPQSIKARVSHLSEPGQAVAIAAKKAHPIDIEALTAEVEQSRETIAVLEAENANLKAELKRFDEMRVQFEKGGFEEIIRGKDEVIRAQASRIETESRDKRAYLNKAEWWKKKAIELGYTDREVIEING